MKKQVLFSALFCLLATFSVRAQNIIYVNAAATGSNNGSSWANAFTDFQAGVNAASAGDSVFVAGGVYQPAAGQSFSMKEGVKIFGGFNGTETHLYQRELKAGSISFLEGNRASIIVNNQNGLTASAILNGFTLTGGNAPGGGGMYNFLSSPSITNCIFLNNHSTLFGGGMYNLTADPYVTNCVFWKNTAEYGGGIANEDAASSVLNCTFWGNTAETGGAIFDDGSTFINCIIYGNSGGIQNEGEESTVRYSIVQGGSTGDGNTDEDPLFVDAAGGNFQLQPGSPAIDKGVSGLAGFSLPATDLSGNTRVSGGVVDMGAYEYQGNRVKPDNNGVLYVDSTSAEGGDGSSWDKALNYLSDALAFADTSTTVKEIYIAKGTYYPTGMQSGTNRDSAFLVLRSGLKLSGGYPSGGGTENGAANPTILSGDIGTLNDNSDNSYHVIVITGIGDAPDSLMIRGLIFTQGNATGSGSEDYPVNGQSVARNEGGGIFLSPSTATGRILFDSCLFTRNNADHGAGIFCSETKAIFRRCTFSKNQSPVDAQSSGGGIENGAGAIPQFINCRIMGNQAPLGAGIMNKGDCFPLFVNCLIAGNNALLGGGIFNDPNARSALSNCTIAGNNAGQPMGYGVGGGIEGTGSSCTLVNCIVWGNSGGIDGTPTVTYSLVQGWTGGGTGNLPDNTDPELIHSPAYYSAPFSTGNFELQPGSPAINAGNNASLSINDTIDLAGNPRISDKAHGGIIDLGAYEYQGNLAPTVITNQPRDTAVCTNDNAAFSVAATGSNLQYQWQSSANNGDTWESIADAVSDTLKLSNLPVADSGTIYRVIVRGSWGKDTSHIAALSVFSAPVISEQPESQSVVQGVDVTFSVSATGLDLRYQWQRYVNKGQGWSNLAGATSSVLSIPNVSSADGGSYQVIISGSCSNITSAAATLSVIQNPGQSPKPTPPGQLPPGCFPPIISSQPQAQDACLGSTVTFNITATGTDLHYQWQTSKNKGKGNGWNDIADATAPALTLSSVSENDAGIYYRVMVANACGAFVYSDAVSLTISTPATITSQPTSRIATEGQNQDFTVKTSGDVTGYQWQSTTDGFRWNDIGGATEASLQLTNIPLEADGTTYRVFVYGKCNTIISNTVTLSVTEKNTLPIPPINPDPPGKSRHDRGQGSGKYFIYPNPVTQSSLQIENKSGKALGYINLYNGSGTRMLQTHTDNSKTTLQLPDLPSGMYTLQIIDDHQKVYTQQIVVQITGSIFK